MAAALRIVLAIALAFFLTGAQAQNNSPPEFNSTVYVFIVNENQPAGNSTVIGTVAAFDFEGDDLEFYVDPQTVNANLLSVFNPGDNSAHIFPLVVLDRETHSAGAGDSSLDNPLLLTVRVTDNQDHGENVPDASVQVSIYLLDVNDELPQFTNLPGAVSIREDVVPLNPESRVEVFQVTAEDRDTGLNARLDYAISSVDTIQCSITPCSGSCCLFDIEINTGIVFLRPGEQLNFDSVGGRVHRLTMTATDNGRPRLTGEGTLTVNVEDANDLNPQFSQNMYSVNIHENVTNGTAIVQVFAFDGDLGINDTILYSIVGGNMVNGTAYFEIDTLSGIVSVAAPMLDRETVSTFTLIVQAREREESTRTETADVIITVLDINDHIPEFFESLFTVAVPENAEVGRVIVAATAFDRDEGTHAEFEFTLFNLRNGTLPFTVVANATDTAVVTISEGLDFEEMDGLFDSYTFQVVATEEFENITRSGFTEVRVTVTNVNDLNPAFDPPSYTFNISEEVPSGSFVGQVFASDGDRGSFGDVRFFIIGNDSLAVFNISMTTGAITTTGTLDFETNSFYDITVIAEDTADDIELINSATTLVRVDIENINDNPPMFVDEDGSPISDIVLEVNENFPPQQLLQLRVADDDGDLTEHTFDIISGNDLGHFSLSDSGALNITIPLDYDLLSIALRTYTLVIEVNDNDTFASFSDFLTINVFLVDLNDNSPIFANDSYLFTVFENEPIGTLVDTVIATDIDSNDFGEVVYSIVSQQPNPPYFIINATTGEILTNVVFDREVETTFILVAMASDLGSPAATNTTNIRINILDRNDNSPQFNRTSYQFSAAENTEAVSFAVAATDRDMGANGRIFYDIQSGNTDDTFIINEATGLITRNASVVLDYERVSAFQLEVVAADGGDVVRSTTVRVDIDIQDLNDITPQFSAAIYNVSISEDIVSGSIVTSLDATDDDSGANSLLTFSITDISGPTELDGSFTLDATTGIVRTTGSFDRELFAGAYTIMVRVEDSGVPSRSSDSQLLVYITDANDNTPEFTNNAPYTTTIEEGRTNRTRLVTVEATDRDLAGSENAEVVYDIIDVFPMAAALFEVGNISGVVYAIAPLDFESVSMYRLTVEASDQGEIQRSSNSFVTVTVLDINDQAPEFTQDTYTISVAEDTPVNTRFSPILAQDGDQGSNAAITYTANITGPFRVDAMTGQVILTASLDFESEQAYSFEVTASDGGTPSFEDVATVEVVVLDANDLPPVFDQPLYRTSIAEGDYNNTEQPLVQVLAEDNDSGLFGEVLYEVISTPEDELFAVDEVTGQVVAIGNLDREAEDFYTITIEASDGGFPANVATARVEITIEDSNDNTPELEQSEYTATVREDAPIGTSVAMVSATDADIGSNGQVMFIIDDDVNFSIDELTGVVSTNRLFDFESQETYQAIITAYDNGTSTLTDSALLLVNISDANDNGPIVAAFPTSINILETQSVGSTVYSVVVTDADSGSNGELVYQLANDEGRFAINGSGVITVATSLDFEETTGYNLTVTISDRGQPREEVTDFLIIAVSDVNDNPPVFDRDEYSFLVSEDFTLGTVGTLLVTDLDDGPFGVIEFEVVGPDADHFFVFPVLGGVDVINAIDDFDYEDRSLFSIRVIANNTASPFHSASAEVTVILRDLNDNRPTFSLPAYTVNVPENAPVGTPVGTVVATDADGGVNGTIVYSFGSGTGSDILSTFDLNATSGVITLNSPLNFETRTRYSFAVVASDSSPAPLSASAQVNVSVMDNNENGPQFDDEPYQFDITENLASGAVVGQVTATDADGTADVEYSIVTNPDQLFAIDVNGLISTLGMLDRELQERYILTVQARDMGDVPLTSFAQVDVRVTDVNDNSPIFGQAEYIFELQENVETVVGTVSASDRDTGSNAELIYTISAGVPFQVDAMTGVVSVTPPGGLDREALSPTISFVVIATDAGTIVQEAGTAMVTVTITDVNDNTPVFTETPYTANVLENSVAGVSVVTVEATDADGESVTYAIISGDDPAPNTKFSIDPVSGLIVTTISALDYEQLAAQDFRYTLTVGATDARASTTQTQVPVVISVVDVNDNAPVCPAPFEFTIPEAQTLEMRAGTVTASDADSGSNAVLSYSIVSGDTALFRIEQNSGILFGRDLDFEDTPVHVLGIQAIDNAADPSNRLSATCTVTVTLEDVNDNPPAFTRMIYDATILENATIGTTITTEISASDVDTDVNAVITYSLQSSTRVFSIDATSGVVTLIASLDADDIDRYDVDVEASDGERIGRATLVVRVLDIDDTRPVFDRSFYTQSISEDSPPDSSIITLSASDRDSTLLFYEIIAGNVDEAFKIGSTSGLIETASTLDREQVAVFTLVVLAEDTTGNNGSTTLRVTVLDVNDEAPQFLQPSYTARVVENSPTGTQVLPEVNGTTIRIEAFDADQPNDQNSRVLYRLEGENADQFNINFDTGIISVALGANLDREEQDTLAVTVVASDSVPAPNTQSSSVSLTVLVLDENDLPPVFTQPFGYTMLVSEALMVGSVVTTTIRAVDEDSGAGGVVRYSLTSATPLSALASFSIDLVSGDLTLQRPLDRETDPTIVLTVTASDQGVPARSSVVNVQVTVADANDNPPTFAQDTFTTTVSELQGVAEPVYTIVAEDPDTGSNAVVSYRLENSPEPFTINPSTGVISTTATLDHEEQASHSVVVVACDNGDPRLCSNATVVFIVRDFNDERPQFDLTVYRVDVAMDTPAATPLVQPVATDRDSGSNAVLTYSLREHDPTLFTIEAATGLISLASDADDIGTYSFTVLAVDGGSTPLSGSATVVVRVLNDTEREFMFQQPYFSLFINERTNTFDGGAPNVELFIEPPSTTGLTVEFAPDYPANPFDLLLNFIGLLTISELEALGLGQGLGLDREVRSLYTVIVQAERNGQSSFTSVTVEVLDANDNSPQFVADRYRFSVRENATAPLTVGTVVAEDRDVGINAVISYTITSVQPMTAAFAIDNATGVISTADELDRENIAEYRLFIEASDVGPGRDSAEVIVQVEDINDCTPTFDLLEYNALILENLPSGVSVTTVTATDCDSGLNATLRYMVVGGDSTLFQLDLVSGAITTLATLDFELRSQYQLRVEASDMGVPSLSSRVNVNIRVQDFNDCPPEFDSPPMSVSVLENATIDSVLVIYEIFDCDSGLNGPNGTRFTIIAGNLDGRFEITEGSGTLLTSSLLDREEQDSYLLSIQARDSAGVNSLSSVTQLRVVVQDVNDNAPVFTSPQVTRIVDEGEELSTELVTVEATDADDDLNGMILYSLENDFGIFRMDDGTGALSLISSLDHELTVSYDLVVIARDRGAEPRSSNATISIIVRDENDNVPEITNIISGTTVVEVFESAEFVTIFTVEAEDADSGSNGEITFSLRDSNRFSITSAGGAISVSGSLDYETQTEYTLVVTATDQGAQQLSGIETLIVRVLDENDNNPVFQVDNYVGTQPEGSPPGTPIVMVTASDADQTGSPNAVVTYTIAEGANSSLFAVDSFTGEITNTVPLDRETQAQYLLTVVANNSLSVTALTATAVVMVTVMDVNDETPEFLQEVYTGMVSELAPIGANVTRVSAQDNDQPGSSNSALTYLLPQSTSSSNPFHIDPTTGVLSVSNSLDFEVDRAYNITVNAVDNGSPSRTGSATIMVRVLDENDQPPQFVLPPQETTFQFSVSEGLRAFPFVVTELRFTDADMAAVNQSSDFSIASIQGRDDEPLPGDLFRVATDGNGVGTLSILGPLDFETRDFYEISLLVRNRAPGAGSLCPSPALSGCVLEDTAMLQLSVENENDNYPIFDLPVYTGQVSSSAPGGTAVITVRALDADIGNNFGTVNYFLNNTGDGRFRIDDVTGTIFTRGDFADLDGATYNLIVSAFDNNGVARSNSNSTVVMLVVLNDFQRVRILFLLPYEAILQKQERIEQLLRDVSGYDIVVEDYADFSSDQQTNFIFHAIDENNEIVDFDEFFSGNAEDVLFRELRDCNISIITPFADIEGYTYPGVVDTQTIVILILCLLLIIGALILLAMSCRQRYLALHDTRHKLLADVFYHSPTSGSVVENLHHENYNLEFEMMERRQGDRQNPVYLKPYAGWSGVDTESGLDSGAEASSLQRDNVLYESQELRMELFADESEGEAEVDADDDALLAAALHEDDGEEEEEENSITAI